MGVIREWEFKDSSGYKWIVKETDNEMLEVEVTLKVIGCDWDKLDEMQREGKLKFVKESEVT